MVPFACATRSHWLWRTCSNARAPPARWCTSWRCLHPTAAAPAVSGAKNRLTFLTLVDRFSFSSCAECSFLSFFIYIYSKRGLDWEFFGVFARVRQSFGFNLASSATNPLYAIFLLTWKWVRELKSTRLGGGDLSKLWWRDVALHVLIRKSGWCTRPEEFWRCFLLDCQFFYNAARRRQRRVFFCCMPANC